MKNTFCFQRNYSGLDAADFELFEGSYFTRRLISAQNDIENVRINLGQIWLEYGHSHSKSILRGKLSSNYIYIGLATKGGESIRCNGVSAGERNLRIYPEGADTFYQSEGECEWFLYSIPRNKLLYMLSLYADELKLPLNRITTIKLSETSFEQLKCLTKETIDFAKPLVGTQLLPEIAEKLSNNLLYEIVLAIANSDSQWLDITPNRLLQLHGQLIMSCETLVASSEDNNLKLSALADATGYSLRALEMIFKNTVGMSPKKWFINMRLNGALRDLMIAKEDDNVAKTATRWGFQHLARFSSTYRSTFSERPSETLARSRKRKIP